MKDLKAERHRRMRNRYLLADAIPELDPEMLAIVEAFASAIVRIKKGDEARKKVEEAAAIAANLGQTRAEGRSRETDDQEKSNALDFSKGPKLLRIGEVASWLSISRGSIYRKVSEGNFPPPRKLGRSVRWLSTDIEAWIEQLPDTKG